MSRCSPYPPAALPSSLSMASSATEPNRDTAAPYEPDGGVRRPGSRALRLVPFFGLPKRRPSEYCETGGALALNGRCSIVRSNNQPNDGFGGGGALERRCARAERVLEDVCPSFQVANGATKKKKMERAMGPRIAMAPAAWRDATTNQKSAASLEYICGRRRAGRRRLGRTPSHLFGHPILGQKKNISKFVVA